MATLTDEQLADLKQKALAATPGPWCSDEEHGVVWIVVPTTGRGWSTDADGNAIEVPVVEPSQEKVADASPKDAAYIAAANPENILALLQRIGELEAELAAIRRDGYAPPGKMLVDEAAGHAIAGNVASNVCCADCTNRVCGVSELAAKRHDWPTSADCYEAHMRALGLVKEPEPVPEPEDENDLRDAH